LPGPLLSVREVSKHFAGVQALKNVSLDIMPGEIHALIGENGAGKSTLVKILGGIYKPDAGTIIYNGLETTFLSPRASQEAGISIIHQELNLALDLSVSQNIFLGREPLNRYGFIEDRLMAEKTNELTGKLGIRIDPYVPVRFLTQGQRQMVEIARALSHKSSLLILDEPTSSLTDRETDSLFQILLKLRGEGVSIIYISHRMEEIFKLADRVTVFRDGCLIGTCSVQEVSRESLIKMMIGRDITHERLLTIEPVDIKDEIIRVENLTRNGIFEDISFNLRKGEVVGLAGLLGAGRTEVIRCIFGAEVPHRGRILLEGKPVKINSPQDAVRLGIGLVPEDRRHQGLLLQKSVRENISLSSLKRMCRTGFIKFDQERKLADKLISNLDIRASSREQLVDFLSGGNQQKVVISKWLADDLKLLILDEPTRGVDVGAKSEIYKLIRRLANAGIGVLIVSSELTEILTLCDRILVLREGKLTGMLDGRDATQEKIMRLAIS
jgi:ribose transport system ATP-binding protein